MGVHLRAKFEVSSTILTAFRQGGGEGSFTPTTTTTSKRTPKKPTQIRVKCTERERLTRFKNENLCFLNLYSVHAAGILDLSLEIMLSPLKLGTKHLYVRVHIRG